MSPSKPGAAVPPAVTIRDMRKSFGGTAALKGVDLEIAPGKVHGLLGENGSGKSTLIKVLAGYHAPDSGELSIYGERIALPLPPGQFRDLGIEFVHQDLGLVLALTVAENLFIGEYAANDNRFWRSRASDVSRARQIFGRYNLSLDPRTLVGQIPPVQRALLAIVRAAEGLRRREAAAHSGARLLVLDEPTVFLPRDEVQRLYDLIRSITAAGASVLFVSHDLDEVLEVTDQVTVLRDGAVVGTAVTAQSSTNSLVEMIVGRQLSRFREAHATNPVSLAARTVCRVEGLAGRHMSEVTFAVREGEVVGLTGLIGSGFDQVPYALCGAVPASRGTLTIANRELALERITVRAAVRDGIVIIPADRVRDGSIGSMSIADNIAVPVLSDFFSYGVLRRDRIRRTTSNLMTEFDVRPNTPKAMYSSLSGGNQQKALLAKWLQTKPQLLLLHEPTQGVDVGARQQVFKAIRDAAADGTATVCASTDHEQLAELCDRVLIFSRGRIAYELSGSDVQKQRITELTLGAEEAKE